MRVVLHGFPHDVGHLNELTRIDLLHVIEDTSLYRLQTIIDMRHSTL